MAPVQTATGIVVRVDGADLGSVDGFDLRISDGNVLHFTVVTLDVNNGLPAAHLREHLSSGAPIIVEYTVDGADLMRRNDALRYNDAPKP